MAVSLLAARERSLGPDPRAPGGGARARTATRHRRDCRTYSTRPASHAAPIQLDALRQVPQGEPRRGRDSQLRAGRDADSRREIRGGMEAGEKSSVMQNSECRIQNADN